jgi:hypothetical protein
VWGGEKAKDSGLYKLGLGGGERDRSSESESYGTGCRGGGLLKRCALKHHVVQRFSLTFLKF